MKPKRRKPVPPPYLTEVNMTPVIDIVFNLVIFFMVVNDMGQRDLAYLLLPDASMGVEDKGDDPERLIVNVVDLESPEIQARIARGEIDPARPPILLEGRQIESLERLRVWMRARTDPRLWPDETKDEVVPGSGIRPSRKTVLIRCDRGQLFGWVQAVMQHLGILPGRPAAQELRESPLVHKVEIAVAHPEGRR